MDLIAYALLPLYLILALITAWVIGQIRYGQSKISKYIILGLAVKLLGSIAFFVIYKFYYGDGDTFAYFRGAAIINDYFFNSPADAFVLFNSEANSFTTLTKEILDTFKYFSGDATWLVVKITAIASLFGMNNYLLTTIVLSFFCFWGQWAMFSTFNKIVPNKEFQLFISCFLVPSIVFWCGGILKDTLMISSVGFCVYSFYNIFFERKLLVLSLLLLTINLYVIWVIKFYIILALIPSFLVWLVWSYISRFNNKYLKVLNVLSLIGIVVFICTVSLYLFSGVINKASGVLLNKAISYQTWHGYLDAQNGGSGYSLGELDFTPMGVLLKVPASINFTFFRPYLWESNSVVVLVAAIESLLVTILFIWSFLKAGLFKSLKLLISHPFIVFCLSFSLFFGFIVGFTSYNYGALVRYKTPCLPFFYVILFLLPSLVKEREKKKINERNRKRKNLNIEKSPNTNLAI